VSGGFIKALFAFTQQSERWSTATAWSHDDDDEDAGSQTTFFCSLSITGLIWQHMNAKLPPGIVSTNTQNYWHSAVQKLKILNKHSI